MPEPKPEPSPGSSPCPSPRLGPSSVPGPCLVRARAHTRPPTQSTHSTHSLHPPNRNHQPPPAHTPAHPPTQPPTRPPTHPPPDPLAFSLSLFPPNPCLSISGSSFLSLSLSLALPFSLLLLIYTGQCPGETKRESGDVDKERGTERENIVGNNREPEKESARKGTKEQEKE